MPRTFSVPRVLRNVVTRQRVVDRLEAASRNPLTVVRAPAGAGKTVAVSDWAERRSSASDLIWITLDSSISGRYAFWARLIDAVNDSGIAPPDSIFANTVPSAAAASGLMPSLLRGLARLERPLTIVIDDYHHIREREVHDDVIWLLQQSSTLSVVVVTRKVSPLESAENLVKLEGSLVLGPELAFSAVCTSRLSQGRLQNREPRGRSSRTTRPERFKVRYAHNLIPNFTFVIGRQNEEEVVAVRCDAEQMSGVHPPFFVIDCDV